MPLAQKMARAAHPASPSRGPRATTRPCAAQSRHGPGECRGHRRPALRTGEAGPGLAGGPGAGYGGPGPGSRGALTLRRFALAVSAIYLGFTWRSASRSLRVNPLPRPRVDCTTPQDRQTGHAQERRATRRPAQAGVAPVSRAPVAGHPRAAGVGGCGGRYRRLPGQRSWRFNPVGSCRGRYHTDRQPGAALQNTAMCPAGPPPARSRTACAAGQSHSTHDTVIRPGPHSCAFEHRSG